MQPGPRLVVVSNRVASTKKDAAGGLAVALGEALAETGGLWFGWSGRTAEEGTTTPRLFEADGVLFATLNLTSTDYNEFYKGFSNRALWPLFHYRIDLAHWDPDALAGYQRVNGLFATALAPLLRPDDLVWVHDYHLFFVGRELRRLGLRHRLGFFLHIPFPTTEVLITLPNHRELVEGLFAYDMIGFQAPSDLRAFQDYVRHEAGGSVLGDGRIAAFGRTVQADVFPIGIDAAEFAKLARSPEATRTRERVMASAPDGRVVIGVDRLDYSKGLAQRFGAFECLLTAFPEHRGRTTLLQVAPPSRSDVPEYQRLRRELEGEAGRINGRFAEFDWAPIRYLNRPFTRKVLAALYRASRVGLVTPFRDGMNLVAKEYVAAQAEHDPGVLVLSRFAGAAQQLDGAMIVNPYDIYGVAAAVHEAAKMGLDERRRRWRRLMDVLERQDLAWWRRRFLAALAGVPERPPGEGRRPGNRVRFMAVDPTGSA